MKKQKSNWRNNKREFKKRLQTLAFVALAMIGFLALSTITNDAAIGSVFAFLPLISIMKRSPEGGEGGGGEADLTEDEKKALGKVKRAVSAGLEEKMKAFKESDPEFIALKSLLTDVKELSKKSEVESLKTALNELGLELKSMKEKAPEATGAKSYKEAFAAAYAEKKAEIDAIVKSGKQSSPLVFEVKAAVTMQTDNTIGSGTTQTSLTSFSGMISEIRTRLLKYLPFVGSSTLSSQYVYWVEETDQQGTPIMLGEGDAKTQLSSLWVEKTKQVKKIAVYGKVTTEMLADLSMLFGYIKNSLMKRMDIVTENQLFDGDDTGDNLKGVMSYATAYTSGPLAGTIASANEYDVVRAVALQCELAYGVPSVIFVHPSTIAKMELQKDENGQYVMPPFSTVGGKTVAGMQVISSTAITAGEFVGGDFSVVNVGIRETSSIQVGLDGNDFINNKKTILCEQRLVQWVSANDTAVLITGDFATAIAELDAGA